MQGYMKSVGLVRAAGAGIRIFASKNDALEWMEDHVLAASGHQRSEEGAPLDLSGIELLDALPEDMVARLRECVEERRFSAGERIFQQGDTGDEMIFVRRGVVDILLPLRAGKTHHLSTVGRGGFFGEMAFLDRGHRSANAVARTDCALYVLKRHALDLS